MHVVPPGQRQRFNPSVTPCFHIWIELMYMLCRSPQGWIHHLARHSVACFLTRGDLYVSWERGQEVFEELLLDQARALLLWLLLLLARLCCALHAAVCSRCRNTAAMLATSLMAVCANGFPRMP